MDLSALPNDQLAFGLADALERASHAAWEQTKAEQQAGAFRAELRKRLIVGEVVPVDEDTEVVLEAPKPSGRRSVNKDGIHRFIETLGPLGLGPVEQVKTSYAYPTVAELERREAVLANYGIALAEIVDTPSLGEPEVVVRARKASAAVPAASSEGDSHVAHRGTSGLRLGA